MRDLVQRTRDRLEILQSLWAAAIVTAALTIGLNVLLAAAGWALPGWLDPAQGFVVFAIVSGAGFLLAREHRSERLRRAAAAATALLEAELGVWVPTGPISHVTLRTLARAARRHELPEKISPALGGGALGARIQEDVDEFERATSHDAGELSPPRANALVRDVIRRGAELTVAADSYNSRAMELLGSGMQWDVEGRHKKLEPDAKSLSVPLLATVDAAEDLEELANPKGAHLADQERDRLDDERRSVERGLQTAAAAAAEQLGDAVQPGVPVATMSREDVAAWRQRIGEAQRAFQAPVAGRGFEMHPISHRAWVATNDAVLDVDRELTDLQERLRTGDTGRAIETCREVDRKLGRLGDAIKWLREIQLDSPPRAAG